MMKNETEVEEVERNSEGSRGCVNAGRAEPH